MIRPWTPAEDALLGTASDAAVSKHTGRSVHAVGRRRQLLSIPRFSRSWSKQEDALLGTKPDYVIAALLGATLERVLYRRQKLGVPSWKLMRKKGRVLSPRITPSA